MRASYLIPIVLLIALLTFSTTATAGPKPDLKIKLPNFIAPTHPVNLALVRFKDIVEKESKGKIAITIYPSAQLGTDIQTFEMVSAGFMEAANGSWSNITKITTAFEPFGLPYLFESKQQYLKALTDKEIRARVNSMLEKANLYWAGTLTLGLRSIGTGKIKIDAPADLKGVRLRATTSLTEVAAQKAFGASPVAVPWSETYDALKTGVVDGETIAIDAYVTARHYEVLKYISLVNFQAFSCIVVFNKDWWNNVKPEYKEIINKAMADAEEWHHENLTDSSSKNIKVLRKAGLELFKPSKYNEFVKLGKATWANFFEEGIIPKDYVELIQERMGPAGDEGWGSWGGVTE